MISYFLCDSWYTTAKVMDSFIRKGFYTIGALKTNWIIYPKEAFGNPKALWIFISTNVELSTQELLDTYTKRWRIELFFRQSKGKLALDKYQMRFRKRIQRYWLIMSLVHYLCCIYSGEFCTFEEGYSYMQKQV
ncbi:transposase [Lactonifactor longoviformis]|uniref:transposase n=1 Tax=Lactonifactor longoviformis TaxID=341220 RepID=UPI00241DB6BD|nr:transposase [Lactonifactor longoviformis]